MSRRPPAKPVIEARLQQTLTGGSEHVYGVAFSPDGLWLAASGEDRTVKLWSLEVAAPTGRE